MTSQEELRELLVKATPGPWDRGQFGGIYPASGGTCIAVTHSPESYYPCSTENEELIVAAVNALPALLDTAEREGFLRVELEDATQAALAAEAKVAALSEAAGMALDLPELIAERNASFDEPNGVSAQNEIDATLDAIRAALAGEAKPAEFPERLREAVARAVYGAGIKAAALDNVREEIRDEVAYALTLALAGSRHPVASDGEVQRSGTTEPNPIGAA